MESNPNHKGSKQGGGRGKERKGLQSGQLLVLCSSPEQCEKAVKVQKINGKAVECSRANDKKLTRGGITGIPTDISVEALKGNIKKVKVNAIKHLKTKRNGGICDSLSVMITFEEKELPDKVFIGFMCYVKLYIPPPLRSYKCQRFGHVAAVCKGKMRCSKCGEHE